MRLVRVLKAGASGPVARSRLSRQRLATQSRLKGLHGGANLLGIATGIGSLQRFGSLQHDTVACAQFRRGALTLRRFAIECLINRLAEAVPQTLLALALQWHGLGFGLPTLLQLAHGVDAQA